MANKAVGEMTLVLEGKEYLLRPSFRALNEIEDRCEMSILGLTELITKNQLRVKHVSGILWGGMLGGSEEGSLPLPFSFEELHEKILQSGYMKMTTAAILFLNGALRGRVVEGETPVARKAEKKTKS